MAVHIFRSALRSALHIRVETYKLAIALIDESETPDNDPAHSSHQRLLAFKFDDVQKRLIENKILLTKLETPGLKQLDVFYEDLKNRVEKDKEVLVSISHIKKLDRDVCLKDW